MSSKMLIRPFQLFNGFPNCFLFYMVNTFNFCLNTPLAFLEKSKFKVESVLHMRRNICDAWYEVLRPKKVVPCFHLLYWSQCWSSNDQ